MKDKSIEEQLTIYHAIIESSMLISRRWQIMEWTVSNLNTVVKTEELSISRSAFSLDTSITLEDLSLFCVISPKLRKLRTNCIAQINKSEYYENFYRFALAAKRYVTSMITGTKSRYISAHILV